MPPVLQTTPVQLLRALTLGSVIGFREAAPIDYDVVERHRQSHALRAELTCFLPCRLYLNGSSKCV